MSGKNKKIIILNKIVKNLNFYDRILVKILKNYTLKVYRMGLNDYFNWNSDVDKVNDLSTIHKID